jgi:hypothetical protein
MSCPSRHNPDLDTDIAILHALMKPGQRLSCDAIADIVGCSHTLVFLTEKKALKKVRERLRKNLGLNHGQFAHAKVSEHL